MLKIIFEKIEFAKTYPSLKLFLCRWNQAKASYIHSIELDRPNVKSLLQIDFQQKILHFYYVCHSLSNTFSRSLWIPFYDHLYFYYFNWLMEKSSIQSCSKDYAISLFCWINTKKVSFSYWYKQLSSLFPIAVKIWPLLVALLVILVI